MFYLHLLAMLAVIFVVGGGQGIIFYLQCLSLRGKIGDKREVGRP